MLAGLSGSLLSHHFAEHMLAASFQGQLGEASLQSAHTNFCRWWREEGSGLGPASTVRAMRDRHCTQIAPMLGVGPAVSAIAGLWNEALDSLWRNAVRLALAADVQWYLC